MVTNKLSYLTALGTNQLGTTSTTNGWISSKSNRSDGLEQHNST